MGMYRDPQTMLKYEAKRSVDLAHMIENISSLSEAAIMAAKVKLPWIRLALLDLKRTSNRQQMSLDIEPFITSSVVADSMGQVIRWTGDTCFIKIGKRRSMLEIRTGQLIWLDGKGGAWFDTLYSESLDPMVSPRSIAYGEMTRLAYMDLIRTERNKTIDQVPHTVIDDSPERAFTIFRPQSS
jgi:hypothetical protein